MKRQRKMSIEELLKLSEEERQEHFNYWGCCYYRKNIMKSLEASNNRKIMAFIYGLIDELMKHTDRLEEIVNT